MTLEELEKRLRDIESALFKGGASSAGHNRIHGIDAHVPRNNYSATAAPAVTDDISSGYGVGSVWLDLTNDAAYVCVDSTVDAAVWVQTGTASAGDHGALGGLADDDHPQYGALAQDETVTGA